MKLTDGQASAITILGLTAAIIIVEIVALKLWGYI